MGTLSPNGLVMPSEFPTSLYESIFHHLVSLKSSDRLWEHFSGSWNALGYRFRACIDYRDTFISYIEKFGSTPPPEERYLQESVLFNFFSSAFSVLEATFYGLYVVGAFINPTYFLLSTARDQQAVTPYSTQKAYAKTFPNDPILITLSNLFNDQRYRQLREIRNILTHRTAPGRRMYVSIGGPEALATEWKLNDVRMDGSIVINGMKDLSDLLAELLTAYNKFTVQNIS